MMVDDNIWLRDLSFNDMIIVVIIVQTGSDVAIELASRQLSLDGDDEEGGEENG